jgi:hypothetical protein
MSEKLRGKSLELRIEIATYRSKLGSYLFEPEYKVVESGKTEKTISEGVKIRYEGEEVVFWDEGPGFLAVAKIAVYIGEHVVLPIASGLLARYLYDKLKEKKHSELRINGTKVEMNAEKIEQLILVIVNQEEEKEKKTGSSQTERGI